MRLALISALLLALVAVVLALAAPAFAEDPITLTIRNNQFVPAELQVPAGQRVELIIKNEQTKAAEFESSSLHREKVIAAGSSASVFVGPLKPGRYEFFDDFHPATRGVLVAR
ncbi:MAG TPA: cupredoxin domain-containing protein [Stellaceae bacterium]|nr:cupredoxin domain-containing protein [Stellaceae bacterium]